MRIASVRTTLLRDRVFWAREIEKTVSIATRGDRQGPRPARPVPMPGSVLVEIETDDGLVGLGLGGGGKPGQLVVDTYLTPLLLEQDPMDIERLWDWMYTSTYRFGQAGIALMAMSGVDVALWDLKGKAMGQPVYQLLGGKVRDRVPVYATVRDPVWCQSLGIGGVKLGGPYGPPDGREGMRKNETRVAEIRDAVGPDMDIMIDCARTWNVSYTIEMARILAPYRIRFIEEPILSHDLDGYARLRRSIPSTMIACGEHVYTRYASRLLLEAGAVDIIQPDIRWTGGLSETLKICDLAAAHGVTAMPHRGAMAWSLHLIMARANCSMAEALALTPEEASYTIFEGEPVPKDGSVTVSDAPGFGLTLKREAIDRFRSET